ncbi:MAG: Hpt domain-containing protein [Candidatus Parcubacteria bacterium]|nr:Hpt domain-containing protein [Candidatus Parcubacteria bacterium]
MAGQTEREFLEEARELIATFGQNLLRYEEAVLAGGKINPNILNQAFTAVHALKGLANKFGRLKMGTLALAIENLLNRMRLKKALPDQRVIDVLFEALGRLNAMLSSGKKEDIIIDQILEKLKKSSKGEAIKVGDKKKREKENAKILKSADIPESIIDFLTEYEEFRLIENIRANSHLVKITAAFDLVKFEEELPELISWLKESGEIITTWPAGDSTGDDKIHFDLLLGTDENPDKLSKLLKKRGATLEILKRGGEREKAKNSIISPKKK